MDPRLLRVFNEELTYLREAAREFGEEHETVAGRLGLKTPTDPDPYVERLLEGVAFLNARVQLKLQDQFPEFTQHLLQAIQPHYLAPTPSMCVVGFEPQEGDQALVEGVTLPRLTELRTLLPEAQGGGEVIFRTGQPTTLWPLRILEAEYLPSRAAVAPYAGAAGVAAEAGLRIRFAATGGVPLSKLDPGALPLFLAGSEATPGELYRQMLGDALAVVGGRANGTAGDAWVRLPKPEPYGFEDEQALLPPELRSYRGYRLLSEYFALPERFLFIALNGLGAAFAKANEACDVVVLFGRRASALSGAVSAANLRLYAAPAVNLFEKQLGRIQFSPTRSEHLLMPDRVRPLDFEVFRILDVQAFGRSNSEPRRVAPLYASAAQLYDWQGSLFYSARLRARRLSTKEQRLRRRSDYVGTETWLSLTAPGDSAALDGVNELAVRALVTNRELPELLRLGGATDLRAQGAPIRAATVLRGPTRPRPPLGLDDAAWRVIAHLTPNYASLAGGPDGDPSLLRDHLALYGRADEPQMRRQVDGVLKIRSSPVTRRVSGQDRLAFARGQLLRLTLDDGAFENGGMFLFSAVIARFLSEFASVNAFVESVFDSAGEGVFAKWAPRVGRRPVL